MTEEQISDAAERLLSSALENDRPFLKVKMLLTALQADPLWTDADLVEVQTRVIRGLTGRLGSHE